ncbi:hypothetical protein GmHk_18G051112 [Glycine max]|nr:hypothetical protein GmHk_18G051112 [Glycine max]
MFALSSHQTTMDLFEEAVYYFTQNLSTMTTKTLEMNAKLDVILNRLSAFTPTPSPPKSPPPVETIIMEPQNIDTNLSRLSFDFTATAFHVDNTSLQPVDTMKSPPTDDSRRSPKVSATPTTPMARQCTKTMPTLLDLLPMARKGEEVPPLSMTQVATQAVLLSSRPISTSHFPSKLPPLVTKHAAAQVILLGVFRTVHQHYRHDHCNTIPYSSVILHSDAANWFCLRATNIHSLIPTPILIWDPGSIFLEPTP